MLDGLIMWTALALMSFGGATVTGFVPVNPKLGPIAIALGIMLMVCAMRNMFSAIRRNDRHTADEPSAKPRRSNLC